MVCGVVAVLALGMEDQFQRAFGLSVFFASVNGWDYGCFKEGFSADDGCFGFFADYVFSE